MSSDLRRHVLASLFVVAVVLAGCGDDGGRSPFTDIGAGLTGMHGCSLAWGDYDSDGDLDLALAGYWYDGTDHCETKVYRNDGDGIFTDIGAALSAVGGHGYGCALAWGDFDDDGDLDLALAGHTGSGTTVVSKIYRNNGGTFLDIGAGLTGAFRCSLAWGDCDNDGDADLAIAGQSGSSPTTKLYRNSGGVFTETAAGIPGWWRCAMAWGDFDNDGDADIAINSSIYRNNGSGAFTDIGAGLESITEGSVAWGDCDSDGDLDLAIAGYTGSASDTKVCLVYRNDAGTFTDVEAGLPGVRGGCLAWGDFDNDGDLDLALAGQGDRGRMARIYRNKGDWTFADASAGLAGLSECSLAWGDYDNDGDLDLALAGYAGSASISKVYRNDGGVFNTAPAAPAGLGATYTGTGPYDVTFSWDSATDTETPSSGLSYNLRVGTAPGGNDIFSGMADVTTGWRRLPARGAAQPGLSVNEWTLTLPAGTYSLYWSVQAVDTAFAGGAWAAEETLAVP